MIRITKATPLPGAFFLSIRETATATMKTTMKVASTTVVTGASTMKERRMNRNK